MIRSCLFLILVLFPAVTQAQEKITVQRYDWDSLSSAWKGPMGRYEFFYDVEKRPVRVEDWSNLVREPNTATIHDIKTQFVYLPEDDVSWGFLVDRAPLKYKILNLHNFYPRHTLREEEWWDGTYHLYTMDSGCFEQDADFRVIHSDCYDTWDFRYDDRGNMTFYAYLSFGSGQTVTSSSWLPIYDSTGKIVRTEAVYGNGGSSEIYFYDNSGALVRSEKESPTAGHPDEISTVTCVYGSWDHFRPTIQGFGDYHNFGWGLSILGGEGFRSGIRNFITMKNGDTIRRSIDTVRREFDDRGRMLLDAQTNALGQYFNVFRYHPSGDLRLRQQNSVNLMGDTTFGPRSIDSIKFESNGRIEHAVKLTEIEGQVKPISKYDFSYGQYSSVNPVGVEVTTIARYDSRLEQYYIDWNDDMISGTIFNLLGSPVKEVVLNQGPNQFDLLGAASGIYFLRLINGETFKLHKL